MTMAQNSSKLSLDIDHREKQSGMIQELQKYSSIFSFTIKTMNSGDYCIADKILIERKTLFDFLESIKSGRLFRQAYQIARTDYQSLIILEGHKKKARQSRMKRQAVQGALIHLNVSLGIPVLRSMDVTETARLIYFIGLQHKKNCHFRANKPVIRNQYMPLSASQKQKIGMIQMLPGLGSQRAVSLMRKFGTVKNVVNQDSENLQSVFGIGKKLAGKICFWLNDPF